MAYDEGLAERVIQFFEGTPDVEQKKMFGGLCFMACGHMCCGIVGETLMARVGADAYETCLKLPYAREMDFTGRAMKGMIYVAPEGIAEEADLAEWVNRCIAFVSGLPPK